MCPPALRLIGITRNEIEANNSCNVQQCLLLHKVCLSVSFNVNVRGDRSYNHHCQHVALLLRIRFSSLHLSLPLECIVVHYIPQIVMYNLT